MNLKIESDRQTDENCVDPDQMPQNGASDETLIICDSSSSFETRHEFPSGTCPFYRSTL